MNTKIVIWLATALVLTIFAPAGAQAVGVGKQCGGFAGLRCNAGLFCQKRPGTCAVIDMSGTCVKVPRLCPLIFLPVCGCDGKTYGNDCARQRARVSLAHKGKCR